MWMWEKAAFVVLYCQINNFMSSRRKWCVDLCSLIGLMGHSRGTAHWNSDCNLNKCVYAHLCDFCM